MRTARMITLKDGLIRRLLQDARYKVWGGRVLTRVRPRGRGIGPWRRAGWVSPSRNGTKLYRRLQYRGHDLYEHRIVLTKRLGKLCPFMTVNHKDLNGLNNRPRNLELVTPGKNLQHAWVAYKRSGMSAAEARANWIKGYNMRSNWRGIKGGADKY